MIPTYLRNITLVQLWHTNLWFNTLYLLFFTVFKRSNAYSKAAIVNYSSVPLVTWLIPLWSLSCMLIFPFSHLFLMSALQRFTPWDIIQTLYCWHHCSIKLHHQRWCYSFLISILFFFSYLLSVFMTFLWPEIFIFFLKAMQPSFLSLWDYSLFLVICLFFPPFLFYLLSSFFSVLPFYLSFLCSMPSLIHSFRPCNGGSYNKCYLLLMTAQSSKVYFGLLFSHILASYYFVNRAKGNYHCYRPTPSEKIM